MLTVKLSPEAEKTKSPVISSRTPFQATPSFSYTVIGSSTPRGICGSGLMELVAELFRAGVIDRKGRMLLPSETGSSPAAVLAQGVRVQGEGREFVIFKDRETEITVAGEVCEDNGQTYLEGALVIIRGAK